MYEILKNKMVQREAEAADPALVEANADQNDALKTLKILNKVPSVIFAYTVPIVGIVFGVWYLKECPAQSHMPIFVIVLFSLYVLDITLKLPVAFRPADATGNPSPLLCISFIVQLGLFSVFISLCYWVYSTHPTTKIADRDLPNYCDYLFYNVTFWGTTTLLTLFSVSIPVWIVSLCCIAASRV